MMLIFKSLKSLMVGFVILTILIAILFWFYLNIQASLIVSAQQTDIRLPASLATKIQVGEHFRVRSEGC